MWFVLLFFVLILCTALFIYTIVDSVKRGKRYAKGAKKRRKKYFPFIFKKRYWRVKFKKWGLVKK